MVFNKFTFVFEYELNIIYLQQSCSNCTLFPGSGSISHLQCLVNSPVKQPIFLFSQNFNFIGYFQSDDSDNFKTLIEAIKKSKGGKNIGVFSKESLQGSFMDAWKKAVKGADLQNVSG